jgi:hypothetical protein
VENIHNGKRGTSGKIVETFHLKPIVVETPDYLYFFGE